MKNRNFLAAIFLLLTFAASIFAQLPQYYNFNTTGTNNSFPFGISTGKMLQALVVAGEYNQPSPAPSGNITKFYYRVNDLYPFNNISYSFLYVRMGQANITTLPTGAFYTGTMDTVFKGTNYLINAAGGTWVVFNLTTPFAYNNTQGLIIEIGNFGFSGVNFFPACNTTLTGNRRSYSVGGPPFVYSGQGAQMMACGVDVSTAPVVCTKFAAGWCPLPTYPNMPAATYFNSAAWLGDTLYVQTPSTAGAGATTIYRYTWNGTWSTGVPCLVAVAGASLTACSGKLYLIGGGASITTGTTNNQEYDPATGIWTARAPLPAALSAHGSVNWGDSVIFIVGGPYTGAGTNLAVHYYRPASNTWGTIASSLPSGQGRRTFACGLTAGNKIVISAGFNTAYLNSTYVGTIGSDATSITWVAGANCPQALSRPAGIGYGNTFFVDGGDTNGTAVKNTNVYVYDVGGNAWFTQILNNPNPVSNHMNSLTARCINDTVRLFQPGGYTGAAVASNNLVVTGCNGIFTGIENISSVPRNYSLSQNYPNPFNPKTMIEFSIPKSGNIQIKVFDILGREVAVLVNEFLKAGSYTVDFNASNLSSGVYLYRLTADGFTATKKMMVIK